MSKTLNGVILITLGALALSHPAAASTWARATGGSSYDGFAALTNTNTLSGDLIAAGYTTLAGTGYGWAAKMNESGSIAWQQSFGGAGIDAVFYGVRGTDDAGCILVGATGSDAWAVRLDENGAVMWQRSYGGSNADWFLSVGLTSDGGFIVGGITYSFGFDSSGAGWMLKLSSTGDIEWQQAFSPSTGSQGIIDVMQASDGRYIAIGYRSADGWVAKLNGLGNIVWEQTLGGTGSDTLRSLQQLEDGSFILIGSTNSFGMGDDDGWLVKISEWGSLIWSYTLGDGDSQGFVNLERAGGSSAYSEYVLTGWWGYDTFLGKIDRDAAWKWSKKYGRVSAMDGGSQVAETPDGGFLVAGGAETGSASDAWLVKTDATGGIASACAIDQTFSPQRTMALISVTTPSSHVTTTTAIPQATSFAALATSATDSFLCASGPMIASVTSKTSKPGSQAVIKGTGFSSKSKKNVVYFGSAKAKGKKAKSTLLKVTIPKGPAKGSVDVRVIVGGVTSNSVAFTIK